MKKSIGTKISKVVILLCVAIFSLTACMLGNKTEEIEKAELTEIEKAEATLESGTEVEKGTSIIDSLPKETNVSRLAIFDDVAPGIIKDEEIINYLIDHYYYYAIPSIMNYGSFESVEELDKNGIVSFLNNTYSSQNQTENLESLTPYSMNCLLPYEKMRPLMKQYFNIENIDVSGLEDFLYNKEKSSFIVSEWNEKNEFHSLADLNTWGQIVENVILLENGNIEADINTYFHISGYEDKVERSYHLVLAPHLDGPEGYYFVSGKNVLNQLKLAEVTGNYQELNLWDVDRDPFNNYTKSFYYIAENEDNIILSLYSSRDNTSEIVSLDKNTLNPVNRVQLNDPLMRKKTSLYGDVLMAKNNEQINFYDYDFNLLGTIVLPEELKKYFTEGVWDDEAMYYKDAFFDYDISYELDKIVFSDEEGIKVMDLNSRVVNLIQEKISSTDRFSQFDYFAGPRYIGPNDQILAIIPGYECISGYFYYNAVTNNTHISRYASEYQPIVRIKNMECLVENQYYVSDATGVVIHEPRILNLENGEFRELPEQFAELGFMTIYYYDAYGFAYGGDFVTTVSYSDSNSQATLSCINYDGSAEQEHLYISGENLNINILFAYKNNKGEINVILQYKSASNENEIIRWVIQ